MGWSESKIFPVTLKDILARTLGADVDGDTWNVTLWDNTPTPDNTVSAANSAYGAGQWVSASGEKYQVGQWAQGGIALAGVGLTVATATVKFDADNVESGSQATLTGVYGTHLHNATLGAPVDNQGLCYNYFGGSGGVTAGLLRVVWHANGIWTIAC